MVTQMKTMARILAAAALLGAFAAASRAQVAPGDSFPALGASALGGGALPETAGKVVLVDFWASWCAPCKASFPVYARLQSDYAPRGLVIVAVSVDDAASAYAAFVARLKPPFATVLDSQHKLVAAVQVPTMPTSYLVDRAGKVRFVHAGFHGEETDRELRRELDQLLSEKPAARRATAIPAELISSN
jgi:thiol-disulfide isomerase/thioredoxin